MGLPRPLKTKHLLAIAAVGLLITAGALYAWSVQGRDIVIEATYLRSPSGLFAEVGFPTDVLRLPPLQLAGCTVEASLFEWTGADWKRTGGILSYGWNPKKGVQARLSVPDAKWKLELRATPHRQLKIGRLTIPVGIRTNIVAAAAFPPRREVEAALR